MAPFWIRLSLAVAGVYNLIWGTLVIISPTLFFRWSGVEGRPSEAEIWQCVGMIVGVYGIGYLIAARDPARHWPIVLVGLLGKIFGPVGFVMAISKGVFPVSMVWLTVCNDLIWWPPFFAALWFAAKQQQGTVPMAGNTPDSSMTTEADLSNRILSLSNRAPVLAVFLRHNGCTFCRETLGKLAEVRQQIEATGTQIVLVHMSDDASAKELFSRYGLEDVERVSDPSRQLYEQFELKKGSFLQLLGPKVIWRGMIATLLRGHGIGKIQGSVFQLPGAVLISNGQVIAAHHSENSSDTPDFCGLAQTN